MSEWDQLALQELKAELRRVKREINKINPHFLHDLDAFGEDHEKEAVFESYAEVLPALKPLVFRMGEIGEILGELFEKYNLSKRQCRIRNDGTK